MAGIIFAWTVSDGRFHGSLPSGGTLQNNMHKHPAMERRRDWPHPILCTEGGQDAQGMLETVLSSNFSEGSGHREAGPLAFFTAIRSFLFRSLRRTLRDSRRDLLDFEQEERVFFSWLAEGENDAFTPLPDRPMTEAYTFCSPQRRLRSDLNALSTVAWAH